MSLIHDWRQAGTTGRAHLVARLGDPRGEQGREWRRASMSACGMVRYAAWVPEGKASRCGLCRRLAEQAEKRGQNMVATPAWEQFQCGGES